MLCDSPNGNRLWVQVAGGGHIVDGEFWRVDTRPVVGAVPGTPAARDPRDAEIERLRKEYDEVLVSGVLRETLDAEIERLRAQVDELAGIRVALFGEVRRALTERDEAKAEVEELEKQRDRRQAMWQTRYGQLIGGALDVQQHLQRALGKPALPSDKFDPDYGRSMVDGLRIDKDKADAEVTRLRERLGIPSETALRDLANRLHAIVDEEDCVRESVDEDHVVELITNVDNMLERAGADAARAIQKCLEVEAERDRLRAELGLAAKELARTSLRVATIETMASELGKDLKKVGTPAAPRRWVAGDPEPEPGVTVTTSGGSNGLRWTLRRNGTWHMNNCPIEPEECPTPGTTWGVLLGKHRQLVEVVSTDG